MPDFREEWFCEASQTALADLYVLVAGLDGDVVEVGCWEGRSTVALARACHPLTVHAVDTWKGSPGEISADLAADRDVLATFRANTDGLNVAVHVMGWRDYFPACAGPTKFLHIDAEHTYVEVSENIAAALPFMVPGSIVCGDDAGHPPVRQAVLDRWPEAKVLATLWWVQLDPEEGPWL